MYVVVCVVYMYNLTMGTLLGHFQQTQHEEIMITQEDIFGINIEEPWAPGDRGRGIKGGQKGIYHLPCQY